MEDGPVDRFGNKISRARIVGAVNRIYIIQPRHHQNWNMPVLLRPASYLPANGKTVHLGHDYVEKHYGGPGALKGGQGLDPISGLLNNEAGFLQHAGCDNARPPVIIYYQCNRPIVPG